MYDKWLKGVYSRHNHIIMTNSTIGNNIKLRRKFLKVTQTQLADLSGLSINTLYKIERGQANPTIDTLIKIADILGMKMTIDIIRK